MYMDDTMLFAKKWKRIVDTDTNDENIQTGYRNEMGHWRMCHAHNEKRKKRYNERNRSAKLRKNQNVLRKGKFQVLVNIGSGQHQTSGDERKNRIRLPQMNEETSGDQAQQQKSRQMNKHSGVFLKLTRGELRVMDLGTTKLMTKHKAWHMRDDIVYKYQKGKEDED